MLLLCDVVGLYQYESAMAQYIRVRVLYEYLVLYCRTVVREVLHSTAF